jgi:hypothetical protein
MTLPGPSRTIIVEPIDVPAKPPPERAPDVAPNPDREGEPAREREPKRVPTKPDRVAASSVSRIRRMANSKS